MDPPLQAPLLSDRRRCREYLLALEEERRKIQVFKRELPLCLELVTQTIEGMKSQMDSVGGSEEETASDDHGGGPVLEEFMPLKPSLSLSSEELESAHDAAEPNGIEKKEEAAETPGSWRSQATEAKRVTPPDWLQSIQLWSQESQQHSSSPRKVIKILLELLNPRKAGGAFQPFEKEKRAELPASSTTAASSAVEGADKCDEDKASTDTAEKHSEKGMDKDAKGKDNKGSKEAPNRKPRRCWAPELHRRFLQALQQLGGSHVATPKQIRDLMKVDGLTNDEVKSHLQKYRLHTRRPNTTTVQSINASTAPPAPQFVVVGGIWMPPPEYAAAAAAAVAAAAQPQQVQLAGDASGMANTVYAPVATLPTGVQPRSQQQGQSQPTSKCLNGRRSGGDSSTESLTAVSSSSHTTSA
ncbi:hypothetical protein HU200_011900 [Digitaria exilis]|uniref:HTH myb-type domain-containing protein n=1 Tax=Digitaria exilis TaxID=1010633 RepID=A0A835FH26_9POAL|nr:hypothetical protein HU200_011900 [Digitaria exilis]